MSDALGEAAVIEARERGQKQIAVIDAGMLIREIFLATAIWTDNSGRPLHHMTGFNLITLSEITRRGNYHSTLRER